MPIMQTVIQGGGVQPSGTLQITTNGTHDVTNYASADVQVPTAAPAHYVEYAVSNGKLRNSATKLSFDGVTEIDSNSPSLMGLYKGNLEISGTFDFGSLETISATQGLNSFLYNAKNITSVNLSNLKTVSGSQGLNNCFYGSGITALSMPKLETVGMYALQYVAQSATSLVSAEIGNALSPMSISNTTSSAFSSAFSGALSLTTAHFYVKKASGQQCFQETLRNCTSLTTDTVFPVLKYITTDGGNVNRIFMNTFQASGITTQKFPELQGIYTNGLTTNPTSNTALFSQVFNTCSALITVEFPKIKLMEGVYRPFVSTPTLTKVVFGGMMTYAMQYATAEFLYSSSVTEIDLPYAKVWGNNNSFYRFCSGATTATTGITINFPILNESRVTPSSAFSNMLYGTQNATVHFPMAVQSMVEASSGYNATGTAFGATSGATILFDLVTTINDGTKDYLRFYDGYNTNSFTYQRDYIVCDNGKTYYRANAGDNAITTYTHTDSSKEDGIGINWTLADGSGYVRTIVDNPVAGDDVFTSFSSSATIKVTQYVQDRIYCPKSGGQPGVGDTIYSDAACTTSVGTISSIV